jgi:Tfp pilus assembly protein PilN
MAIYKQSIDFLPKLSVREIKEAEKVSKASIYAAVLPLLASLIWVIAMFINSQYKADVADLDATIAQKEAEIATYNELRQTHTELVLKVDALTDVVSKDFYPQKFFDDITKTIKATNDAKAEIYAYAREEDGTFTIQGKANSYLDLAKIMVVFRAKAEFEQVEIDSIYYDRLTDSVNFEISFIYSDLTGEPEV